MDDYDIGQAFAAIEEELINSMIWNMKRHRIEEVMEEKEWTMWQAEQLKALELYKKKNREKYGKQFESINSQIDKVLREANKHGCMEQEKEILEAIKNGFKGYHRSGTTMQAEFFKLNERKLEALIKATKDDMKKAETAVLRMADDRYRKTIYYAQVYANTGAGTYEKAVDMATKDFLSAGMNCIEYANGARHTVKDYADMAIRTANKRAYLQGEGMKRQEWGIHTVIMNKRGNPCPKCLPFVGKVLIDDVWSGGSSKDGPYPLMSTAVDAGLYHPRCKDSHTTYFPGISTADDTWTKEELAAVERNAKREAKQQYAKRQAERFERLARYSLDSDNQKRYAKRKDVWNQIKNRFAEKSHNQKNLFEESLDYVMNEDTRRLLTQSLHRVTIKMSDNSKSYFDSQKRVVYLAHNAGKDTIAHELFHEIDSVYGITENEMLKEYIQKDYSRLQNLSLGYGKSIEDMLYSRYKEVFVQGKRGLRIRPEYRGVSDILNGMSEGKINLGYFHSEKYWTRKGSLESETWAQFGRMLYLEDQKVLDMLKFVFPNTYSEVMRIVEGMIK